MTQTPDNAGVQYPPPLVYAAAVVGGYLVNRVWPAPIGDGPWLQILAAILIAAWAGLMFASFGLFRRGSTSIIPNRPANALVITGPYRFTRNPMYVSLALLTIAHAIIPN